MTQPRSDAPQPTADGSWQTAERLCDLLAETPSYRQLAQVGLNFLLEQLGRTIGALVVAAPQPRRLMLLASCDLPPDWEAQLEGDGPLSEVALELLADPSLPPTQFAGATPGTACAVSFQAHPVDLHPGVLLVGGEALTPGAVAWLLPLLRHLGRALYQARQTERREQRAADLTALQIAVTTLGFNSELEEMQVEMIQGLCRVLDAEMGSLVLVDEDHPDLVTKKSLHAEAGWLYHLDMRLGDGLIKECLRSGAPFRLDAPQADPRFNPAFDALAVNLLNGPTFEGRGEDARRRLPDLQARSLIVAPLAVNGHILGAVEMLNHREGPFTPGDLEVLAMIAELTAHGIYGTRLIQQLQVANADLEASHWELLRSRNTLRALFDSMPAALYIIDQKYKLLAINKSCALRVGKPPQIMVGRQCYEALYARPEPCPGCRVNETLFSGDYTNRTERRWGIEEDPTEWEISTYPIHDEEEQVVSAILLEEDVTERRRLESILAQSEKLAAVGQLAAGVAHEINNPLTAIIANAQILQRELPQGDEELQESIDLIIRAGARATQVVRNLLDFARKEQYNLAPTDINETIQRALALVQHELLARSIEMSFEPGTDLPALLASQDHLQGVWLNLLLNSIDAVDREGGGKLRVVTRRSGSELRASFIDNGQGIPPERISRIFEPFYTTKAPGRGTGLGLSVCHRIIKQHGGHMLVDSQLGVGTEFTVVLPIS